MLKEVLQLSAVRKNVEKVKIASAAGKKKVVFFSSSSLQWKWFTNKEMDRSRTKPSPPTDLAKAIMAQVRLYTR